MTGKKQKVPFLDIFRCACIMAVILIHMTSDPVVKLSPYPVVHFYYLAVNLASSFAVPAFLFLSAFVLFYNYQDRWNWETGKSFFTKRLLYTIVPYLIWSVLYYVGNQLSLGENIFHRSDLFFYRLLTGKNYAHLYYIIIMVQFYLLFPVFMALIQRSSFIRRHLIAIAVFLQGAFFLLNRFYLHIPTTGSMAFSYFLFYLIGAYLGLNYQTAMQWLYRQSKVWMIIWLAAGLLHVLKGWILFHDPNFGRIWMPYAHLILYDFYVTLSCLILFRIASTVHQRWGPHLKLLTQWGEASFFIYLAHPGILLFWRKYVVVTSQYGYQLTTILGGVASLLIPWYGYRLLKKYPYAWLLMGQTAAAKVPDGQDGESEIKAKKRSYASA